MRNSTILILFFSLVFVSSGLAQDLQWARTYGTTGIEIAYDVQQTADGGYILAGDTWFETAGWNDFYIVKTDASGDTLWTRKYGGTETERAYAVHQTQDGGYYVSGFTETFGAGYTDFWLLRMDSEGDTLWSRTYGTASAYERGYCGDLLSDGGYVIGGLKSGTGEFYVVRVDTLGTEVWTNSYKPNAGPYVYEAFGIQETEDGGFIIAGNGDSLYVVKTAWDGSVDWAHTYGEGDLCYDVDQTSDGGYVVTGATPVESYYHVLLMKLDAGGNTLWSRDWDRNENSRGHAARQTEDGGYVVAGFTFAQSQWVDSVYVIKTDPSGDKIWEGVYGGWTDDQAWDIEQTTDGGYIVAGYTASFGAGDDDFFLLKLSGDQPPVSIELIPDDDPVVVEPGGSFSYTGILQNNTNLPLAGDVWVMVRLPGGSMYGPVKRFDGIPLGPQLNITVPGITQEIPFSSPPGTYGYTAYCGLFSSVKVDSSSFDFTVTE